MTASSCSSIAQLLCHETLPINFARLVGEMDKILEARLGQTFRISMTCDGVACFDAGCTRILLAWNDLPGKALAGVLTVSVGPSPVTGKPMMRPDAPELCGELVDLLQKRLPDAQVLWHQIACHMSAEWVEILIDALPDTEADADLMDEEDGNLPEHTPDNVVELATFREVMQDPDLIRIRSALYDDEDQQTYTPAMRLAVHAMNATLIMVWMPLGAAALVHGMVKGEDMRLASRLMVLTGSVGALMQTPLGQNLLDIARL